MNIRRWVVFINEGVVSGGATNEVIPQGQLNGWKTMEISARCFLPGAPIPSFRCLLSTCR